MSKFWHKRVICSIYRKSDKRSTNIAVVNMYKLLSKIIERILEPVIKTILGKYQKISTWKVED